jgi:hypothetical protein
MSNHNEITNTIRLDHLIKQNNNIIFLIDECPMSLKQIVDKIDHALEVATGKQTTLCGNIQLSFLAILANFFPSRRGQVSHQGR